MVSGESRVGSGEWGVESGEWRVECGVEEKGNKRRGKKKEGKKNTKRREHTSNEKVLPIIIITYEPFLIPSKILSHFNHRQLYTL
jgi:hypothetical protein